MNVRKEKGIGLITEWPFSVVTENGVENIVNSMAVYRGMTREMTDISKQYLTGNYMEATKAWQKVFTDTNKDIMGIMYKPYTQVRPSLFKESVLGADVVKYWQESIETPPFTQEKAFNGMKELFLICVQLQKNTLDLFIEWDDCAKRLAEPKQITSGYLFDPQQACESWISICERFFETLSEVNITFMKKQTETCMNILKSIISRETSEESAKREEENTSPRRKRKNSRS